MTDPRAESPRSSDTPSYRRRRRRRSSHRRRNALILTALTALAVAAAFAFLAETRYLPALEEAGLLRGELEAMASRAQDAGLDIDQPTIDGLVSQASVARRRLARLSDLLASDPLVGVARALPPISPNVRAADSMVAAAADLLDAVDSGLVIGSRFVGIKQAQATNPGTSSALAGLVELMATSRDQASAARSSLARAHAELAAIPEGLAGPVESVRGTMSTRVDKYLPLLDSYVTVSARLPEILGWDGPRRYLILTQDPAELRPTGGIIGSYGIVAFDRGRVTELSFFSSSLLDIPFDYPHIDPPKELADYLLGPTQPWQLTDSNWSPDFPTSAQTALRLYTNESGDARIDGVLGITTYTIDELLKVTGPITVPGYGATIASGETTLKTLQLTRVPLKPGENRKAFLSDFGHKLFAELLALPPKKWSEILSSASAFQAQHLVLTWFKNSDDQALAKQGGFDGSVRQDPGDYVYPLDSNVFPVSKLNGIATRTLALDVTLDPLGNATNTLDATWQNPINTPAGKAYRELPTLEKLTTLGMYFRLLAPEQSRIQAVSGGTLVKLTAPAVVAQETNRIVVGTYLAVPPGTTSLRYVWISPYAVETDDRGGLYRLTIQKQPGLLPGPLTLRITVPTGYEITATTAGLTVNGGSATLSTIFDRDIVVGLRYESAASRAP